MTHEQIYAALNHLIGTRYVDSAQAYISEISGRSVRIIHNGLATSDYFPDRLNVEVNAGAITGFSFG